MQLLRRSKDLSNAIALDVRTRITSNTSPIVLALTFLINVKSQKVLPKPALGVKSKSLFIKNTLTFINNYLLLFNINENTILLSVYASMTDILTLLQHYYITKKFHQQNMRKVAKELIEEWAYTMSYL